MKSLALVLLALFLLNLPALAADDVAVLRAQTQALMDAVAPGDKSVWERYLHPDFMYLDENGALRERAAFLEALQPLPPGLDGRIAIDTFTAKAHGNTMVTFYELQEHLDYHGQILRSRFRGMDTWLKTKQGWQLIGTHVAAVLKNPPQVALSKSALCEYKGRYALTPEIVTTIDCGNGELVSERPGRPTALYRAELRDVFFVPGQPRTRRIFERDANGNISGFVDRREGEDIHWKRTDE